MLLDAVDSESMNNKTHESLVKDIDLYFLLKLPDISFTVPMHQQTAAEQQVKINLSWIKHRVCTKTYLRNTVSANNKPME